MGRGRGDQGGGWDDQRTPSGGMRRHGRVATTTQLHPATAREVEPRRLGPGDNEAYALKKRRSLSPFLNEKSLTVILRDLSSHNAHDHGTLGKGGSGAVVAVAAGGDRQEGASVSDPPPLPAPHRHVCGRSGRG